ncbi:MAG: hypothetical protein V1746_00465 [bacterium]
MFPDAAFYRRLSACQGYLQLGMPNEALEELDSLPVSLQKRPETMHLRAWVLMKEKEWTRALEVAENLCKMFPYVPVPFLDAAYCLHELHKTNDAREKLLKGPPELNRYPTFHYNLACYEAKLGLVDSARGHLEKAILMDPHYRREALHDPDLKILQAE